MRLEQFTIFCAVAEERSIRKAAEKVYMSPQNLSKALLSLEEELHVKLFERYRTGVELTAEGERAYKRIRCIIEDVEALRQEFNVHSPVKEKKAAVPVYISCSPVMEPTASALVTKMMKEYPDVNVQLEKQFAGNIREELLREGKDSADMPDIAVMAVSTETMADFLQSTGRDYTAHILYRDELHLQVSENSPLAKQKMVTLEQCRDLPFFLYSGHPRKQAPIEMTLASLGCVLRNVSRTSSLETCSEQALAQNKFCFVGYPSVKLRPLPGAVYVPLERKFLSDHILFIRKNTDNPLFCHDFCDRFTSALAGLI